MCRNRESNREKTDSARMKIRQLLDKGSFMEIGEEVTARLTDFYTPQEPCESDGVVTGYGTINEKLVYIFCQDADVMGGTFGEMHGRKINRLYRMAMRAKAPIIGLLDCRGFRIEEGLDGLNQFASLYRMQAEATEKIPQIMAVLGRCGGGMSVAANMADFVFVEKEKGDLFLNSANLIDRSFTTITNQEDFTDGKMTCCEIMQAVRTLIEVLPPNTDAAPERQICTDDLNRICKNIDDLRGDGRALLRGISDENFFFETRREAGKDMVTGFIRLNGGLIGAAANHGCGENSRMTAEGFDKAASFVSLCDRFHIPVLTITDTEGFDTADEQEIYLPKAAGRMIKALACAKVPKVNLITGEIYGSAYSMMNSRGLGADYVFMWKDANVNIINPRQAVEILYPGSDTEMLNQRTKDYRDSHSSAGALARHGYADKIIQPEDTRKYLIGAFETFANIYQEKSI